MSRDDYPPVVKHEGADMTTDTPICDETTTTPRTDAAIRKITVTKELSPVDFLMVPIEFGRELERELTAATQRIAELEREKNQAAVKALEDAMEHEHNGYVPIQILRRMAANLKGE